MRNIVVKLGSRGVLLKQENETAVPVPGFPVKAVDTTGAGDAFNGAFAVGLLSGKSPVQSAKFANAVAAISVTRPGAQPSMPTRNEVESFSQQVKSEGLRDEDFRISVALHPCSRTHRCCKLLPGSANQILLAITGRWWETAAAVRNVTLKDDTEFPQLLLDPKKAEQQLREFKEQGFTGVQVFAPADGGRSYNGLDARDHYRIEPKYGSIDDFKRVVHIAHGLAMPVVVFTNLGYSALDAPAFLKACDDVREGRDSKERKWFFWSDSADAPPPATGDTVLHGASNMAFRLSAAEDRALGLLRTRASLLLDSLARQRCSGKQNRPAPIQLAHPGVAGGSQQTLSASGWTPAPMAWW